MIYKITPSAKKFIASQENIITAKIEQRMSFG